MARKKATVVKRNIPNDAEGPSKKKAKFLGRRRRILALAPPDATLFGPLRLPWTVETPFTPLAFKIIDDTIILADEVPLNLPEPTTHMFKTLFNQLQFVYKSSTENELVVDVGVKKLPLQNTFSLVKSIFFNDLEVSDWTNDEQGVEDWKAFFKEVAEIQKLTALPETTLDLKGLKPRLRSYQAAAVIWMIQRERVPAILDFSWLDTVAKRITATDGSTALFNTFTSTLFPGFEAVPICSGGILADEMGLGKTVIALALIMNNKNNIAQDWEVKKIEAEDEVLSEDEESDGPTEQELNQESHLDANEKLQLTPNKGGKGFLKSQLMEWYENKLAEMKVGYLRRPVSKRRASNSFKCTCSEYESRVPKKAVRCESCGLYQHRECGGYKNHLSYVCCACWSDQELVPSGTTLVITPPAIFTQWASEIERHTPSLKCMLYTRDKGNFVQPLHLAEFDVVITTYSVLQGEIHFNAECSERNMRRESRYLRSCGPLSRVSWYRIVCDEAQMVESDMSQMRALLDQFSAQHKWCVTGTPVQKSIADLYHLTSFMGIGALDQKSTWIDFLLKPYKAGCKEPLLSTFSQLFWRSSKEEVATELRLPEQTFQCHVLKFSAIEETFYNQQHSLSAAKFAQGIRKSGLDRNRTLKSIDKSTLTRLLTPLLNLRQACTHAQVVSGITINSASGAASLTELLQYLSKKATNECEEALRRHVAALNGLAGLHCLNSSWGEAIECYRAVFRLAEECKGAIHVDTLQRIHALFNAGQTLDEHPGCAPPTIRDEKLMEEALLLEDKYLAKADTSFKASWAQANAFSTEVKNIVQQFESSPGTWWVPVVLKVDDHEDDVLDKIAQDIASNDPLEKTASKNFIAGIRSMRSVEITVSNWWSDLEKNHKTARKAMKGLTATPSHILVEQALNCHLRATKPNKQQRCDLCKVERQLLDLECQLFATVRKKLDRKGKAVDSAETKGSWKPHYAEKTLWAMWNIARSRCDLESWIAEDAKHHGKLLEVMKKEFKQVRAAWTALNHRVHAQDELTMARQRLRFAEPWEAQQKPNLLEPNVPGKADTIHLVPPGAVMSMMEDLAADKDTTLSDYKKKNGRMLYLENLKKDRNSSPEPCPVCTTPIDTQWCVLQCGHCLCIDCLQKLHAPRARQVKCPVCRENTLAAEIGFVDTSGANQITDTPINGDYSTKVDAIVRQVLKLLQKDPTLKILIFSTWVEVLKILGEVLGKNNVSFLSLPKPKHQAVLQKFKEKSEGVSVLLLPISWGAKGLNLIEATHVFLVEPILNPSEELQAIGRVHRIGQKKPTVVHRFIVKNTVEEKIFEVVSEAQDTWSNNTTTLADLQNLFDVTNRSCLV